MRILSDDHLPLLLIIINRHPDISDWKYETNVTTIGQPTEGSCPTTTVSEGGDSNLLKTDVNLITTGDLLPPSYGRIHGGGTETKISPVS